MNNNIIKAAIAVCLSTMMWSCSESKDEIDDNFVKEAHLVNGKVEKGPMVRGSSIEMRTLNKKLVQNGSSYTTTIENNNGEFNFGSLEVSSPYAKLTADGYFFDEVRGQLSESTIKLDAFVDLTDNTSINVNILTHLKSQRINNLVVKEGKDFKEANEQAQKELLTQFGLQNLSTKDASQFSIASGDDAAGALIAVSSLILANRSEAQVVEFLSQLTNEFSASGQFSESSKKKLINTRNYLNDKLDKVADNIRLRYKEFGKDVNIKDLQFFFDWDGDGIAGNDVDASSTIELSQNVVEAPKEGGTYTITIKSDKPYYLERPKLDYTSDGLEPDTYYNDLYENYTQPKGIVFEKSIDKNTITLSVSKAEFRSNMSTSFEIFNSRGKVAATITVNQSGDPSIKVPTPNLGKDGKAMFNAIMFYMSKTMEQYRKLESTYLQSDRKEPYNSASYDISEAYQNAYMAISRLARIKQVDANALGCYQPYFDTYLALSYYYMASYWGGVCFYTTPPSIDGNYYLPRLSEAETYNNIISLLENSIESLDEKRNDSFSDANSALFVSKDVARVVLAFAACNQKDYKKANTYLEKVISNGYYSLINTNVISFQQDSECILGLIPQGSRAGYGEDKSIIPCLDYKDVLLTAAECNYHLGNTAKAKEYIQQICNARPWLGVGTSDILKGIYQIKYTLHLTNTQTFVRRNSLATSLWGIPESQYYQLLWPIPSNELLLNPSMTQNPGY